MPQKQLVLASTSPYRRELLGRLGLSFEVANPETDETPLPGESPTATALRLSEAKARAVAQQYPEALIIGSDQVAIMDGRVFGKPGTHAKAVEQLRTLSGKTVNFFTGLCVLNAKPGKPRFVAYLRWSASANWPMRKLRTTCAANRPTTAPDRPSRKVSGSPC